MYELFSRVFVIRGRLKSDILKMETKILRGDIETFSTGQ